MVELFARVWRKRTHGKTNDRAAAVRSQQQIAVRSCTENCESAHASGTTGQINRIGNVSGLTGGNRAWPQFAVFAKMDLVDSVWAGSAPIVFGVSAIADARPSFFLGAAAFYVIGWPVHKVTHAVAERLAHRIRDG
jgi:hypothetical protein